MLSASAALRLPGRHLPDRPRHQRPAAADNSTKLATTAFVVTALGGASTGVTALERTQRRRDVATDGRDHRGRRSDCLADVHRLAPDHDPAAGGQQHTDRRHRVRRQCLATATAGLAPIASVPVVTTTTPLMDGTAAIGVTGKWADGAHVHPVDTSRYAASNPSGYQTAAQVAASLGGYLPLTGGGITGNLSVNGTLFANAACSLANEVRCSATNAGADAVFTFYNSGAARQGYIGWVHSAPGQVTLENDTGGGTANVTTVPQFVVNCTPYCPGGGSWIAISDARIKTVEGDYPSGLEQILALRPVVYTYNGNEGAPGAEKTSATKLAATSGKKFAGLVAQEAETVMPEIVTVNAGWIDGKEVADLRHLDPGPLVFALINAVKTLTARIEALEAQ